jgi:hypothetical protein
MNKRNPLIQALYNLLSSGTRRSPMSAEAAAAARANVVRDAQAIAKAMEATGFTYDLKTGRLLDPAAFGGPDVGLPVANIPKSGQITQTVPATPQDVINAFDEFNRRGQIYEGSALGGWNSNGNRVFDPSNVFAPEERRAAMRQARAFDQDAAFDFSAGKDVSTTQLRQEFQEKDVGLQALAVMLGIPVATLAAALAVKYSTEDK